MPLDLDVLNYPHIVLQHRFLTLARFKGEKFEMYVDLGAYGIPRQVKEKKPFDIVKCSREVEQFVHSVNGFQMLYATSYLSRPEFRAMFNHEHYDKMKAKYDKDGAFPEVYEKTCKVRVAA